MFPADEETDDAGVGQDYLPLDNEEDDAAAVLEARLLLRGSTSPDSQRTPSVGTPPPAPATGAAANAGGVVSSASPPLRKRGRPNGSKKPEDPSAWEPKEVSVTITGGSFDIDPAKLSEMEAFLEGCCVAGMFALERGGSVSHLHLQVRSFGFRSLFLLQAVACIRRKYKKLLCCSQGVLRMRAKTVRGITLAIKQHLGWDKGKQPAGSRVMCRGITGDKLHTWAGLVGYCCKDMHEPHFQVCWFGQFEALDPSTLVFDTLHACMSLVDDAGGDAEHRPRRC